MRITPEAIEITSFPGFDRSISEKDVEDYHIRARIYRNRRIGDFLKELKLIEGRNTGFPNAFRALKENGSGLPVFEMNPERDYLSVTIPVHPYFLPEKTPTAADPGYDEKILSALRDAPLTITQLSRAMGYKGVTAKLRRHVDSLFVQGKLLQTPGGEFQTLSPERGNGSRPESDGTGVCPL